MPSAKLLVVKLLIDNTVFATFAVPAVFAKLAMPEVFAKLATNATLAVPATFAKFASVAVDGEPATKDVPFQINMPLFPMPEISTSANTLMLICSTLDRTRALV